MIFFFIFNWLHQSILPNPPKKKIIIIIIYIPCILTSNLHNMNEFGHFARDSISNTRTSLVTVEIEFDRLNLNL